MAGPANIAGFGCCSDEVCVFCFDFGAPEPCAGNLDEGGTGTFGEWVACGAALDIPSWLTTSCAILNSEGVAVPYADVACDDAAGSASHRIMPAAPGNYTAIVNDMGTYCCPTCCLGCTGVDAPCIVYDGDSPVTIPFTITCPQTAIPRFAGPNMSRWSVSVEFDFNYPGGCPFGATVVTETGQTYSWGCSPDFLVGCTGDAGCSTIPGYPYPCSPAPGIGGPAPVGSPSYINQLLLASNGAALTLSGTVTYNVAACGLTGAFTASTSFTLNFCDGPCQKITTVESSSIGP